MSFGIARSVRLASQYPSVATVQGRFRSTLTSAEQCARSAQNIDVTKRTLPKNKRVIYALVGGTACLGLFGLTRSRNDYRDDPRDINVLSTVPLSKLCSGWM
jgi:hypothetical protein